MKKKSKRITAIFTTLIMVLSSIPIFILSVSAAGELKIPSGAKHYGGHMYYVYKADVDWKTAKKLCEKKGGHLATITAKGENNFISELVNTAGIGFCWLGATDEKKEGKWKWITGEKFKFKNWNSNQPDNWYDEDYLGTYKNSTEWNDFKVDAGDISGYVCEWDIGKATGIKQVSATSSSVVLSWKDNDLATKYIVYYYDTSAKKYIKYKTVTKSSITIKGLSSSTTYKMAISTVYKNKGKAKIAPKTTFKAVTTPGKTKKLKIEDKISLTWSKVKGADGYAVYLFDTDTEKWELFDRVKKNSCKIGKKFGSTKQSYKVRAYKKSSDGKYFYGGYSTVAKR